MKTTRITAVLATAAVMAVPVAADAHRGGRHHGNHGKRVVNKGFVVTGNLKQNGFSPDETSTTSVNESVVGTAVKNANKHARQSGELEDQNSSRRGVQVRGGTYKLDNDNDFFRVVRSGYEPGEQPGEGDKVRITGKIPYTRDKSLKVSDRYGEPNIRRVKVVDSD
jgi:hypothetical protein